jgi:N-acetylglutamate synthase-like GNAT family acetyltransferase
LTVCDSAAGETCPICWGQPITAHWGVEDPAAVEGSELQKEGAFVTAFKHLRNRISVFVSLPIACLDHMTLGAKLHDIGGMEGATAPASEDMSWGGTISDLRTSPLTRERLPRMREALRAAKLPADDLDAAEVSLFSFELGADTVGYGGLEVYGSDALLRSIVVDRAHQRRGVGRRIVDLLLARAASMGASHGYLLTIDARAYFEALGFAVVSPRDAPPSILATRQALGLCPASAVLMAKAVTS